MSLGRGPGTCRRPRVWLIPVIVTSALLLPSRDATADHTSEEAEWAAREILDARERANAAAQAMFDAESQLDTLTIELDDTERRLGQLESEAASLRSDLTDAALRRLVGAGPSSLPLFTEVVASTDNVAAAVYAGAATGSELVRADEYDEVIDEVDRTRDDLERRRAETADAHETFSSLKGSAEAEVLQLQQLEEERLQDAAVQHELERLRLARVEQERQEQERDEQERRRRAAADAQAAAASASATPETSPPAASSSQDSAASSGDDSDAGASLPPSPPSTPNPSPTPTPPPTPAPEPATPANAGSGMACPVAGPRSFADTWGAPRSGGRRHQGVDMMAPGGTPLVAVESGSVRFKTNRLGGNAVWLAGASGTRYYYAHLSSWEGSSRSVDRGEVIGYVGATGNATVNHLHFEVHPGGGTAVNPYPYVRAAC